MSVSKAKNIDIQNLYLLNMPAKLFIAGLAIAGVLAIGYVGIFKEQLETLSTVSCNAQLTVQLKKP